MGPSFEDLAWIQKKKKNASDSYLFSQCKISQLDGFLKSEEDCHATSWQRSGGKSYRKLDTPDTSDPLCVSYVMAELSESPLGPFLREEPGAQAQSQAFPQTNSPVYQQHLVSNCSTRAQTNAPSASTSMTCGEQQQQQQEQQQQRRHKQPGERFKDSACDARMEWVLRRGSIEAERSSRPGVHYMDLDPLVDLKAQPSSSLWIDRPRERKEIEEYVKRPPNKILCILGPRNCGKSALMSWLCENSLQGQAMLFDCRGLDTSSPEKFAGSALRLVPVPAAVSSPDRLDKSFSAAAKREGQRRTMKLEDFFEVLPSLLQAFAESATGNKPGLKEVAKVAQDIIRKRPRESASSFTPFPTSDLATFMQRIMEFTDAWWDLGLGAESGYPVIVIDEANLLYGWKEKFSESLQVLKSTLLLLTKQRVRCHVILVSSDFGFLSFLQAPPQGMNNEWLDVQFINGLEEDEARKFFGRQLEARNLGGTGDMVDKAWASIYEVCGGNPQELISLANYISAGGDDGLANGLEAIERNTVSLVTISTGTRESPSPLRLPFAKLVTAMLASPLPGISLDMAVGPVLQEPYLRLRENVDREEVVKKLTAANLLMTRPCSSFGEEARPELFNKGTGFAVFPPGRAMLHIMRKLEPELRQELDTAEQQWKEEQQRQMEREVEEKQLRQLQMEREKLQVEREQLQVEREQLQVEREQIEAEFQYMERELEVTPFWRIDERRKLREAIRKKAQASRRLLEGGAAGGKNE